MRGIPDKLQTKQDLINVCATFDPARAAAYLKTVSEADIRRIGVTSADLRAIRQSVAQRKRDERRTLVFKTKLDRDIAATEGLIDDLGREIATNLKALQAASTAEPEVASLRTECASLRTQLYNLGPTGNQRPVGTIRTEIALQEDILRQAREAIAREAGALVELQRLGAELVAALSDMQRQADATDIKLRLEEKAAALHTMARSVARMDDLRQSIAQMMADRAKAKSRLTKLLAEREGGSERI